MQQCSILKIIRIIYILSLSIWLLGWNKNGFSTTCLKTIDSPSIKHEVLGYEASHGGILCWVYEGGGGLAPYSICSLLFSSTQDTLSLPVIFLPQRYRRGGVWVCCFFLERCVCGLGDICGSASSMVCASMPWLCRVWEDSCLAEFDLQLHGLTTLKFSVWVL